MSTPKALPERASLEALRKAAKKLVRNVADGDAEAVSRVRAQLGKGDALSLRDAQLVLAREYGFGGWAALKAEVLKRAGVGLEWAAEQAQRAIHDNDVERLNSLVSEYPALTSWRDPDDDTSLLAATTSYANDASGLEDAYTRPDCAELLIDAGALVDAAVWERVITTGSLQMLDLLRRKRVLPRTLAVVAALGEASSVRELCITHDVAALTQAFLFASRYGHRAIARALLDRSVELDTDLARRVDGSLGRDAFVDHFVQRAPDFFRHSGGVPAGVGAAVPGLLWRTFVTHALRRAMTADDLTSFDALLDRERHVLDRESISIQVYLLEHAPRSEFAEHLLDRDPAILHQRPPPRSMAITFALEYGRAALVPALTRIWPIPDDLPHAAGLGDFERVRRWFDADGQPDLGDPNAHYTHWDRSRSKRATVQHVLDAALAWACMNHRFEIAEFLLAHGGDIDTRWSTHEPASMLHECALRGDFEIARFLIDKGIDPTIRDSRFNATAEGWARHAAHDEAMAEFLAAAAAKPRRERSTDQGGS